jgi:hypothetical protein
MIYFSLSKYFLNQIKQNEHNFGPQYQFLYIHICMIFLVQDNYQDPNINLLRVLENQKNLIINFDEIKKRIESGGELNSNLFQIVFYSPDFTEFIRNLLKVRYNLDVNQFIEKYNQKKQSDFHFYLESFDIRINFFFFLVLFSPIGIFLLLIQIEDFSYLISLLSIEIILLYLTSNNLIQIPGNFFGLVTPNKQKKEKLKIDRFFDFFQYLAYHSINNPPEIALIFAKNELSKSDSRILGFEENFFDFNYLSLEKMFQRLIEAIDVTQISFFLKFLYQIYQKNAEHSSIFFDRVSKLLKTHQQQGQRLEVLLKNSRFKIQIYKILVCFILGFLSSLTNRLNYMIKLVFFNSQTLIEIQLWNVINIDIFFITAFISVGITLIFFNRIEGFEKKRSTDIIAIFIFLSSFFVMEILSRGLLLH